MGFYVGDKEPDSLPNIQLSLEKEAEDFDTIDVYAETDEYDGTVFSFVTEEDGNGKLKNFVYINRTLLKDLGVVVKNM